MKKFWTALLAVLMVVVVVTEVHAQDLFMAEGIDVWWAKAVAAKGRAEQAKADAMSLQFTNHAGQDFADLVVECYTSPIPLSETQLTLADAWRTEVNDTIGYTDNVQDMFPEWGITDQYSPMAMMMLATAQGPWKRESRLHEADRNFAQGQGFEQAALAQDQLNSLWLLTYESALSAKQNAVDAGLPYMYMMMYDMMVSWAEDQLFTGFVASYNKWNSARDNYIVSWSAYRVIESRYSKLLWYYNVANGR